MNRLLLILILTLSFQTLAKADDIRDFQIEGMSIGDSLLDHMSLNEITKKINTYDDKGYIYNYRDFYSLTFQFDPEFQVYDAVQIIIKDNDQKYKIYSISGIKYYQSNINDCYEQMIIIEKEFDIIFLNAKKKNYVKRKHVYDKTGRSTTTDAYYYFPNEDSAGVHCFDWAQSKDIDITDQLNVILNTNEFSFFLNTKAYK